VPYLSALTLCLDPQLDLAYDSMIKALEREIQDLISSSLVSLEKDHLALLAIGQEELQRINKLADVIDESGDVCVLDLPSPLSDLPLLSHALPLLLDL
jgi:hypothetical protein